MEAIREGDVGKSPGLVDPSLSDWELIDRICDGCRRATEDFFVKRYGWLRRYLSVRHGDEELTSDILLHLCSFGTWARLRKRDGRSQFSTWLAVVAYNLRTEEEEIAEPPTRELAEIHCTGPSLKGRRASRTRSTGRCDHRAGRFRSPQFGVPPRVEHTVGA